MNDGFTSRLADLRGRLAHPDFGFETGFEHGNAFLRVICASGKDNRTGLAAPWNGRKWRLSPHMTDGEIVQTAFLAVMTAAEHEQREKFSFDDVTVFDPHYDIHQLVALRRRADSIAERAP